MLQYLVSISDSLSLVFLRPMVMNTPKIVDHLSCCGTYFLPVLCCVDHFGPLLLHPSNKTSMLPGRRDALNSFGKFSIKI